MKSAVPFATLAVVLTGMAWLLRADGIPTPTAQRLANGDVQIQYTKVGTDVGIAVRLRAWY